MDEEEADQWYDNGQPDEIDQSSDSGIPEVGMQFEYEDHAYRFYNSYGWKHGFSIRKSWFNSNKGIVSQRRFCCSKEGQRGLDKRQEKIQNPRPQTRTGCKAEMIIRYHPSGTYHVIKFEASHNHETVAPPFRHILRSQRKIGKVEAAQVDIADGSGIAPKSVVEMMGRQAGSRKSLGFLLDDVKNYLRTKREKKMESGIAGTLIKYFKRKQLENPTFFHSMQLDAEEQITNIFWADARMIVDYAYFGDVICFDATYRTNNYERPFAPFIGVNHHRQTIIFGGALLYDETAESYIWLFETFLEAMSGKKPKTILTDQSAAMAKAISIVMPETHHRLCVWHLQQNAIKHLSHLLSQLDFKAAFFACLYNYETKDEFFEAWQDMLVKYDVADNSWLLQTYNLKEKWALAYGKENFCADMRTTQRSESFNSVLRRYLSSQHDPLRFFEHFERVVDDRRHEEIRADFKMINTIPNLIAPIKMLTHAASLYTAEAFGLFQIEYQRFLECSIYVHNEAEHVTEYKVKDSDSAKERIVIFDSSHELVTCTCKNFESMGIQCRHVLKVLDYRNIKELPSQYILKRWTKDAKSGIVKDSHDSTVMVDPRAQLGRRYQELCHMLIQIASRAAENEEAYKLVKGFAEKIMGEVEMCLKRGATNQQCEVGANVGDEHLCDIQCTSIASTEEVKGFKRKGEKKKGGKPTKRLKGPLERCSTKKRSKNTQSPLQTTSISSNLLESYPYGQACHTLFTPTIGNSQVQEAFVATTQFSLMTNIDVAHMNGGH